MTRLDMAFARMAAAPSDDSARLRYYDLLAGTELCLLLEVEAANDSLCPQVFDLEQGRFVLVFDGEDRLAGFSDVPVPYAALPGRVIAALLAGQGIGLGINLSGISSLMLPHEAVDWLAETLQQGPRVVTEVPRQVHRPDRLPVELLAALDLKLGLAAGLAEAAYLAGVTYNEGRRGHLLVFAGTVAGAEPGLAKAVAEALTFSGIAIGALDVGFAAAGDPLLAAMMRHGLALTLPPAVEPAVQQRPAPGSDPLRPPKLR